MISSSWLFPDFCSKKVRGDLRWEIFSHLWSRRFEQSCFLFTVGTIALRLDLLEKFNNLCFRFSSSSSLSTAKSSSFQSWFRSTIYMLRSHYTILVRWDSRWLPQRRPWWWVGWRSWWFGRGIGSLPDAQGHCDDRCQFKYCGVNVVVKNCLDSNTSRQRFWSRLIDYSGYKHFPTYVIMKKYIKFMKATCGHPWWDKRG